MSNTVAIVGRPNVGKSTLFNRLLGYRKAIKHDESGVTRDRHYGQAEWTGRFFTVIDTGGYVTDSHDVFEAGIRKQVEEALAEADVILFMVDVIAGLSEYDRSFAQFLHRMDKPVILVTNKSDSSEKELGAAEFYELGFGALFPISAETGTGTGDLLDEVVSHFKSEDEEDPFGDLPRISILGKPNVGKSSFLNLLLGKERALVTDEAGTTRDAIDSYYKAYGQEFIITDTAGLRRKNRVKGNLEFYSTMRSIRAMHDSKVCIVIVDAREGLQSQDMNIISLANRYKKGVVLLMNKWDLVEKDSRTADTFRKDLEAQLSPMTYIPILFTSMVKKQRVFQAIQKAMEVYANLTKKVPTSQLNAKLMKAIERFPPPTYRSKMIRIKYVTQLPTRSPSFAFFCNHPKYVKEPYKRYLENQIREHFDFEGVPIQIFMRKK